MSHLLEIVTGARAFSYAPDVQANNLTSTVGDAIDLRMLSDCCSSRQTFSRSNCSP
jgi:hypothetical protein